MARGAACGAPASGAPATYRWPPAATTAVTVVASLRASQPLLRSGAEA